MIGVFTFSNEGSIVYSLRKCEYAKHTLGAENAIVVGIMHICISMMGRDE